VYYPWVIVDGYSLLHRCDSFSKALHAGLDVARRKVVRRIEEVSDAFADRVSVVFDGRGGNDDAALDSTMLEIVFSPRHLTADSVIERMVHESRDPDRILVVTSDRAERETVSATGAHTMSCGEFLEQCDRMRGRIVSRAKSRHTKPKPTTLGDFFPDSEH